MGILLLLPLMPAGMIGKWIHGEGSYNTLSAAGKTAKRLDEVITRLKEKTLFQKTASYPILRGGWVIPATISYFSRKNPSEVVEKIAHVVHDLHKDIEALKNSIDNLSRDLNERYRALENEIASIETIQAAHLKSLQERLTLLKETQAQLATRKCPHNALEEYFKQIQIDNQRWLDQSARLNVEINRKSIPIVSVV